MLAIGKKAPAFTLKNQEGKSISLNNYLGKKIALFFYPKDSTPTCTVEACNLRDNYSILQKENIEVIGISTDDETSHKKFIAQQKLPYTLLCDTDKKVVTKYDVWKEKSMFGNKYMGIVRTTFLIDEKGKIAHIISPVKSKEHSQQILKLWK